MCLECTSGWRALRKFGLRMARRCGSRFALLPRMRRNLCGQACEDRTASTKETNACGPSSNRPRLERPHAAESIVGGRSCCRLLEWPLEMLRTVEETSRYPPTRRVAQRHADLNLRWDNWSRRTELRNGKSGTDLGRLDVLARRMDALDERRAHRVKKRSLSARSGRGTAPTTPEELIGREN